VTVFIRTGQEESDENGANFTFEFSLIKNSKRTKDGLGKRTMRAYALVSARVNSLLPSVAPANFFSETSSNNGPSASIGRPATPRRAGQNKKDETQSLTYVDDTRGEKKTDQNDIFYGQREHIV